MTNPSLAVGTADLASRARIREAALRLYAEHGTQATSIRMVAEEAGLSAGAVMHHFKSKDEMAEAVQHAVVAKIREVVNGVGLDQPPPVAARARRQAFDQLIVDNPVIAGYIRRVTVEGGPAGVALFTEAFELVRSEMQELVEAKIARPLPDPRSGWCCTGRSTSRTSSSARSSSRCSACRCRIPPCSNGSGTRRSTC